MGFGFKYHVVTVAAIFFALTVGLVVGSLLLSPTVASQQANQITKLQALVKEDFVANKTQKEIADKALAALVPAAIKDKMAGDTVAIVLTGSYPDAVTHVRDTLTEAGARISSVTTIDHEMDRPDELLKPALTALNNEDSRFPTDREALAQQMASIIGNGDVSPISLAGTLKDKGYMQSEFGTDYATPARFVIIVAGSQLDGADRVENVDLPLITAFRKLKIEVMMCEPSDARVSDVEEYRLKKLGVTTIDNIDEPVGRCSLVFATGGERGDYGIKATASALYPPELARYTTR